MRKLFYTTLVILAFSVALSSCKKDKKTVVTPPAGALQIWSNVHIIDSTQWILFVNSVHPANGIYMYTFTPNTPNINVQVGDILVGSSNGGYIRKVTAISISGAYYTLQTAQAYMTDVFKSGSFNFQIPLNDPNQGSGISRSFSNFGLYHNSSFAAKLLGGQLSINPNINLNFSFDSAAGLTNFQMSTTNTSSTDSIVLGIKGVMPYNWVHDTTLSALSQTAIQQVTAWTPSGNVSVPVVVRLTTSFISNASGGSGGAYDTIDSRLTWTSSALFTGGLQYIAGSWTPTFNSTATNFVAFDTTSLLANAMVKVDFLSQISSSFYSLPGPQITIGFTGSMYQNQQSNGTYYGHRTDGLTTVTDAQPGFPIFSKNIGPFTQSTNYDSVFFQTPYKVTKISGDNQTANVVSTLPLPLVIKVTDSNGQPVSNVVVKFAVTHGGGTLTGYNLRSDINGFAQVSWMLGPPMGNQNVTVTVVDGANHPLLGAPAVFNATGQ